MNASKEISVIGHGLVGWALCTATTGIGRTVTSNETTLIIQAIAAPVIFAIVSLIYFRHFNYTGPLRTAAIFLSLVVALDFFLVGLVVHQSLDMFGSLLGTWIPFVLIFGSTYITGLLVTRGSVPRPASGQANKGKPRDD